MHDVSTLPDRITPQYKETSTSSLLTLHWPQPPRNILLIPKLHAPKVTADAVAFANHLHKNYPHLNLVFESRIANHIHDQLPFPIYTADSTDSATQFPNKIDLVTTLGGDGTILRAASLFSLQPSVPPILSFSMGSLGFLGEWKFHEFKRAWRQVYMSGSSVAMEDLVDPHTQTAKAQARIKGIDDKTNIETGTEEPLYTAWASVRGKSMGPNRTSKILLRHRIRVGVYDTEGNNINGQLVPTVTADAHHGPLDAQSAVETPPMFHAINELLLHRGGQPHLAIIDVFVNNHFLTEAICDGILVSTPTGSTAYSLSAGGAIIHPLVGSILITPICPRSLSFRPLVLPLNTKVVLRLSERNRGRELEVSIDGKRRTGARPGMEIRVEGEMISKAPDGSSWNGGVPCVIRDLQKGEVPKGINEDDDGWVGGLNGLLKFNYPFGKESP